MLARFEPIIGILARLYTFPQLSNLVVGVADCVELEYLTKTNRVGEIEAFL